MKDCIIETYKMLPQKVGYKTSVSWETQLPAFLLFGFAVFLNPDHLQESQLNKILPTNLILGSQMQRRAGLLYIVQIREFWQLYSVVLRLEMLNL